MNWVREKLAERRIKWLKRIKRTTTTTTIAAPAPTTTSATETTTANPQEATVDSEDEQAGATAFCPAIRVRSGEGEIVVAQRSDNIALPPTASSTTTTRTTTRSPNTATSTAQLKPSKAISKLKSSRQASTSHPNSASSSTSGSNDVLNELPQRAERENIRVHIICPSTRVLIYKTDVSKRLSELKTELILELSKESNSLPLFATDPRQLSSRYRLFRADFNSGEADESKTLLQLRIADNDTLVLAARRTYIQAQLAQMRDAKAPTQTEIDLATHDRPTNRVALPMVDINEIFQQSNLQFDVRKVVISLAQAAAVMIGAGPYAGRLVDTLKQKLVNKRDYQNDSLKCLTDMGFSRERAEYALRMSQGVYSVALEFLIQNQGETPMEEAVMNMQKSQSLLSPSTIMTDNSTAENTAALLEIVRIYSHRYIPPSADAVEALLEMGFPQADVLMALKKTCNNKAAAAEWLCGCLSDSLLELRDGLAQDSPILKCILEMPQVQLKLGDPRTLLAFLSILENENAIRMWSSDNETSSVITHILQKYHEEKHVLGINQFYGDR